MAETKIVLTADARGVASGARQAVASLGDVEKALGKLQSMSAKALSFAGLGIGGRELIELADQYGALTARLQLATQYTGDYAQVQSLLRAAADDTRAPLKETVDLYTKLAPALQGLGKNASQSVGVITTINKAIALSGVSAESAQAALVQFGQGLGSGVLRGEELNSILEQTPALADAIAEGLGITRGELKKWGEEGKLSALAVTQALEKVTDRVNSDFAKLPMTVGQATTYLMNALTDIVGGAGQSTGAMASIASAIKTVADGMRDFDRAATELTGGGLTRYLQNIIDGFSRVARAGGAMFAAFFAAKDQLLTNGIGPAKEVLKAFAADLEKIMNEPWAGDKQATAIVASQADMAKRRLALEKNLADEVTKLENLKAFAAGKAGAEILKDDKAKTDEQIKNAERLRDALRSAWDATKKDIASTRDDIDALFVKAKEARQTGTDKAADRRNKGLTPEEQDALAAQEFQTALQAAEFNRAVARSAALDGRAEVAKKAAEQAARDAERAVKLADKIQNDDTAANAIEDAANLQAKILEDQAAAKQKQLADLEQRAASQAEMLRNLDQQLTDLQTKAASLQVQADVTQAEAKIEGIKAQLDALPLKKEIEVVVKQTGYDLGAALANADAMQAAANAPQYAIGGYTGPGGKWKPAGIVHAGEFVIRQEVVRQRGVLEFLARLNRSGLSALNGYANGGLVSRLAIPSGIRPAGGSDRQPLILDFGDRRFAVTGSASTGSDLQTYVRLEALKRGKTK